jgi:hypothetical protein
VARLCALTSVTSMCLSKLGVGRSRPIEDLNLAEMPAWSFLDLNESDVEPILTLTGDRLKESQSVSD